MNIPLIEKVLRGKAIIPEFQSFKDEVDSIYNKCVDNREGEVSLTLIRGSCVVIHYTAMIFMTVTVL